MNIETQPGATVKTMNDERRVMLLKQRAVRDIARTAEALHGAIVEAHNDLARAIVSMNSGYVPVGVYSHGPLGHQQPADLQRYSSELHAAMDLGRIVGLTSEQIEEAYATGISSARAAGR